MTRPSPEISATSVGVGKRRRGNNGLMYKVTVSPSGGQRRWALDEDSRDAIKRMDARVDFQLEPKLSMDGAVLRPKDRIKLQQARLDFASSKPMGIVWKSAGSVGMLDTKKNLHHIESIRWDASTGTYRVAVRCSMGHVAALKLEIQDVYEGEDPAWTEGDVHVKGYRMDLRLAHLVIRGEASSS